MGVGRNERCTCGSGRKAKRCCGVRRGPSEADLARAFLAGQARPAARLLGRCPEEDWDELEAEMIELPSIDASLQLPLPRLLTPDVDRLLTAIEDDDLDGIDHALPPVLARLDTPVARAELARAVLALRDQGRIDAKVAAMALIDLSAPDLRRLVSSAVLQSAFVMMGEVATPTGLRVAG
ncbi:MAG TPA: SEC-C domain-containing protein [Acidimicrobiales bacterium]|nr:SEC-C domain-containing protein [Acidimicrobiales bacterium]